MEGLPESARVCAPPGAAPETAETSGWGWPVTTAALNRLRAELAAWRAAERKRRALKYLKKAIKVHPQAVAEFALSIPAASGFTLHKDGQEFGVFVGGKRVIPPEFAADGVASGEASPASEDGRKDGAS